MGQQQLLLIILGVIIVSIAISFGIFVFNAMALSSNKDGLISDLNEVSSDAFAYFQRARLMGGGNGSYFGYVMPPTYVSTEHGDIAGTIAEDGRSVSLIATSRNGYGTISAVLDDKGKLTSLTMTGEFQ